MNLRTDFNRSSADAALRTSRAFDLDTFATTYGGVAVSTCRVGTLLYHQGEPADAMYYLQSGQAQITVVSSQGKEGILNVLEPGDWCGEGCLLGKRQRVATASCIADSVVARLERTSVIRSIRQNPAIAESRLPCSRSSNCAKASSVNFSIPASGDWRAHYWFWPIAAGA
jgi:CRP-like cAMP-binding protein